MEKEYVISITARERKIICNLLKSKIKDFNNDIENMKVQTGKLYSMEIGVRKQWIRQYHNLIKKLYEKQI